MKNNIQGAEPQQPSSELELLHRRMVDIAVRFENNVIEYDRVVSHIMPTKFDEKSPNAPKGEAGFVEIANRLCSDIEAHLTRFESLNTHLNNIAG